MNTNKFSIGKTTDSSEDLRILSRNEAENNCKNS